MVILPAIDMKGGRCVRLRQGRAEDETVYAEDPVAMARRWRDEGAACVHLVDLDGAFEGQPVHEEVVLRIAADLDIPVQVGGGIRSVEQVERYLGGGVERVIVGTRAVEDEGAIRDLAERFGPRLAVGIDARDGFVQVRGWQETTAVQAVDLACRLDQAGVEWLIYTDTARDGMMQGVNAEAMGRMCDAVGCRVIASGGVSGVEDVRALCGLARGNLWGAIVGKALYEGAVTLRELMSWS